MPVLGTKGANLDLLIRQGATQGTYHMAIKTQDDPPSAIDLTGAAFRAQVRKTPDSAPLEGVSFVFTITNALDGLVDWSIPATSTEKIPCSEIDETQPESIYVWDMEVELASGRVMPLLYGKVNVFREVSKVD